MPSSQQTPPQLRYADQSLVVPGDLLGTIRQVRPGHGTYVKSNGHVHVSLAGKLQITRVIHDDDEEDDQIMMETDDESNNVKTKTLPKQPLYTCSVQAIPQSTTNPLPAASDMVLKVGQIVVGAVTRITPQMAVVDIVLAQHVGSLNKVRYEGAIRMEDIRSNATEQIVLGECFQPNDVVACRVVTLGDARRYFLSTAETGLGVLRAKTVDGTPLIPVSWKEMECPVTGNREPRKVAKPITLKEGLQQQQT
ncbi:exosome complex exonuclease [Nitzschia inconspicua]|uniref:Exosome complex exonuclease n=1 Tax=Nitzschia inconspicua TaxID=303405 RepID=A0A9K3PDQ3_9STRA|nr:exosome complex exonuclease [Nitzschia inconspicua]